MADKCQKADAEEIATHNCEYYLEKDGKYYGCKKMAFGIGRCRELCLTHYNLIRRDNKKRNESNIEIPTDLALTINNPPVSKNLCTIEIEKPKDTVKPIELDDSTEPLSYVENEEDCQFD
jgi:hypothetical protein